MADHRIFNPFKPTAGKTPPRLIDRDDVLRDFVEGLDNGPGAPGRLLRITGMRGMGKTVVLNEFASIARKRDWLVVDETALPGIVDRVVAGLGGHDPRGVDIVPQLSMGPVTVGVGGMHVGTSATLTLRDVLARRIDKLGAERGVLILLDEVQSAPMDELAHLATAIQHQIREDRNIAFVFAGLPSAVDRFINEPSLTFLRRATPETLEALDGDDIRSSMRLTIEASGMHVGESTLGMLVDATAGYPFMVQLVGYYAWQQAYREAGYQPTTIRRQDASEGIRQARRAFDLDVIEPALSSLSNVALRFLLAMSVDDGPSRSGDVAKRLERSAASLGKYRGSLMRDSLIVAPRRGVVDFSMPYMRDYLRSHEDRLLALLGEF
ncbi:MAG: ATP-binding protein [Atopobiaceae bacterium]|nr:ATP-binding protein [Atopobiaceae bacterium]